MGRSFVSFDASLINVVRRAGIPFARFAIFVIYFYFGFLKLVGQSPADSLVRALFERTIGGISFESFFALFALYEMAIGAIFLVPGLERLAIALFLLHMGMTALPLLLLPNMVWRAPGIPTLEGQYIIKNVALIALAASVAAHIHPWRKK